MSKYYKVEDVISFLNTHCPKDMWEYQIADLPTIEVNEDCISREQFREQMYHRCFEVDNDPNMQKWDSGNWLRWKLFEEELENAPSVVPKQVTGRAEGEWIDNEREQAYMKGHEDGTKRLMQAYMKGCEDGRKSVEVNEDCISRTYLEEQLQQIEDITAMAHIDLGEDPYDETEEITMPISTVRKIIKNAPSVVPKERIEE